MLDRSLEKQILEFVQEQPRTIQEVAQLVGRNWRTANTYIERIAQETGLIAIKTFRGGTRGALKIVYWNALTQTQTSYQERLAQQILAGREKADFSPFDIFQFVPEDKRRALITKDEDNKPIYASEQVLSFSGNLSWVNKKAIDYLEPLARKHVAIKIMCRVDITSKDKVKQLLAINQRVGWDAIVIRHCAQPIRAVLCDDLFFCVKEVFLAKLNPELDKTTFIYYEIMDQQWIHWLQKIFWKLWETSIDSADRLAVLESIAS